ncbi:MAG: helix-turn-helix transcriptional regulator [Bacteroidota bacterium]
MPDYPPSVSHEAQLLTEVKRNRLVREKAFARENWKRFDSLSRREKEILSLICKGLSNASMAEKLDISVHTVRTHRNRIWRQLGINHLVEAIHYGQAFDLV